MVEAQPSKPNTDPTIQWIRAWSYPEDKRLDPGGAIARGSVVRMYARIHDAETSSGDLTVSISYMPQGGTWTTATPMYHVIGRYWYVNWTIPGDTVPGLYDVKVDVSDPDGGSTSSTELGEYEVILWVQTWIRTGECAMCGHCCKPPHMNHPPMLNVEETECKYLEYVDETWICAITAGNYHGEAVDPESFPEADLAYWQKECQPYPNPDDTGHCPPRYTLCVGCGFTMVEED